MKHKQLSLAIMVIGGGLLSSQVLASGYNFGSQSVSAQGTAHANAAEANDPTTIYYNPAGLSRLDGTQLSVGITDVVPDARYTDSGTTRSFNASSPSTPSGQGDNSSFAPQSVQAPTLYVSHQLNDRVTLGLGVFVPFGAKLGYGNNWVGRYSVESIDLKTLNFNPSVSFKLDDKQSLGFGISAQYMKASMNKAVDANWTGLASGDAQAAFSADGWGYGINLGYLYQLDEHTRFGLAYRSEIRQTLKGNATWDWSQVTGLGASTLSRAHPSSAAESTVTTPQSASASFYHDLNDKLAVMGTVTWTGHSSMDNIDISFPGAAATPSPEHDMRINQSWKNSWLFALGANYKVNDALMLRGGLAYDQTPVPNDQLRHPALPDSDRYWVSLGANYKFDKANSVDFSYSYVFLKDSNVDYTGLCRGYTVGTCPYTENGENTKGSFKTSLQLIGLQYNHRF